MFCGFAGAGWQVVDVDFRNICQWLDLFFQQLLIAQIVVQFLAAAVILVELFEMPAQFPEQKRCEQAILGGIVGVQRFGVS